MPLSPARQVVERSVDALELQGIICPTKTTGMQCNTARIQKGHSTKLALQSGTVTGRNVSKVSKTKPIGVHKKVMLAHLL